MVKAHGLAVGALLAWALLAAQPAMGQDPVDGVCHDVVRNGCSAGTPNDAALADTSNAYKWRCDGLHGGQDSRICFIRVEDVVDGVCDESRRNGCSAGTPNAAAYPDEPVVYQWRCDGLGGGQNSGRCALWFSVVGVCDESVRNGCSAGNPNDDAFPDSSTEYAWRCDGLNAGANSGRCSRHVPVNGACDDSARNGCSAGTANDDAVADTSNAYLWRCDGLHGGSNSDKCHMFKPVNGVCNDSVRNGCAAGVPNDDAFPDAGSGGYVWRCDGEHGGRNSSKCFIRSVDGVCDDSVRNGCSAGTPNDDAIADTANAYLWRCDGLHGGANSEKCHKFIPVDGVCDENVRNGCAAGTANDGAVPDSSNAHLWRCDGLHGGANSEKCFKFIPVDGACDESVRNGCSAGTANDDAIADTSSAYLWRCDGLHGGTNSEECRKSIPVDGACDESVRNGCSAGTANDAAVADTASHYQWRCDGSGGGSNSGVCSAEKPVAPVSCGTATWSPATSTVCSGQSFTQTRTCNSGCNTGDCATSRNASGTKSCVRCGASWSPAASAFCSGMSFTQTRTCNAGCNTGDCSASRSASGTRTCVGCGTSWSPATSTVCSGQSFTQTRTCPADCNVGDCSTSRRASGTKSCTPTTVVCGSDPWSPASATFCPNVTRTQTRSCNAGCNTGDCSTRRRVKGTKTCVECGDDPWTPWSPATSTQACDTTFTQTRTRECNDSCNIGDCRESEAQRATGTQPRDCRWGSWTDWSPWGVCSATCDGGTQSRTRTRSKIVEEGCGGTCLGLPTDTQSRSCNTHSCRTCECTANTRDSETAGAWSDGSGPCTASGCRVDGGWSDWGRCTCTASTTDSATAGTQSRSCNNPQRANDGSPCSGQPEQNCTTSGNCPIQQCNTPWTKVSETSVGILCGHPCDIGRGDACDGYDVEYTRTCGSTTERKTVREKRNCRCARVCV